MKRGKSKILLLVAVMSAVSIVGCAGNGENSDKGSNQQNQQMEEGTKSVAEYHTVKEWMENLKIVDKEVGLPCAVEDLPEGVTLGAGTLVPGYGGMCDMYYDGNKIGSVHFECEAVTSVNTVTMKDKYLKANVHSFKFTDFSCFEIMGVKLDVNSNEDTVVEKFGATQFTEEDYIMYQTIENDKVYEMQLYWNSNGTLSNCSLVIYDKKS